ncbi:MAG: M20/M25/M40 family metallo-hydrolase [Deltaproteobacteria bacterium]|nr:M20/M25/M40 family metallo-hydrolase [Deltaproteobacteria bacterium]
MDQRFLEAACADLADLIEIGAPSRESNLPVIARLEAHWRGLGWTARRMALADDGPPRANLLLARGDAPTVLFCCHVDTVPPGDPKLWTASDGRPRTPVAWRGQVFGLGASDTLGSAAVLDTLAAFGRLPGHAAVAFTADEEVGAVGAAQLVASGLIPRSVGLVVVCEPTENRVVTGQKGYVPFDVIARDAVARDAPGAVPADLVRTLVVVGQEAHSARPATGRNALFEMAHDDDVELIQDTIALEIECRGVRNKVPGVASIRYADMAGLLMDGTHHEVPLRVVLDFLRRMDALAGRLAESTDGRFDPPGVTLNVGSVSVQGRDLVFACDARHVPGVTPREVLDAALAEARAAFGEAGLRHPFAPLAPVWTEPDDAMRTAFADCLEGCGKSAYTEAAVFAEAGFRTVIAGPGNLLVHRPNEHVDVAALHAGGELYVRLAAHAGR